MIQKKIGVLLPQSKQHPTISKDFMNGLRLSLETTNYEFKVEGIGFGDNVENSINAIQKLTNQEEVNLITGLIGHTGLKQLLDYVESIDEKFIYADFGATRPINLSNRKNILCNSLDLYGATEMLANFFVEHKILEIITSTCYYESGYYFIEAMQNALQTDKKSNLTGHFITPLNPRVNEAELMKNFVDATNPDAIFAFHNGVFANEHAAFIKENKININTPLYTLPFSVEDKTLEQYQEIFHKTRVVSSWFLDKKTKENNNFIKKYKDTYGKKPTIFAVLGYENGILIKNEIENNSTDTIVSPRGILQYNNHTNRTVPKHELWEILWENNSYNFSFLTSLDYTSKISFIEEEIDSGWQNAYLSH